MKKIVDYLLSFGLSSTSGISITGSLFSGLISLLSGSGTTIGSGLVSLFSSSVSVKILASFDFDFFDWSNKKPIYANNKNAATIIIIV